MEDKYFREGERKYEEIPVPGDLELTLKRTFTKAKRYRKHILGKGMAAGLTAAILAFIMLVNVSPSFARAISGVPLLRSFAELAQFDDGFRNLVESDKVQTLNFTASDNGARFTVHSIAGDDLRLWIAYEFEGKGLKVGSIKAKLMDGSELPWSVQYTPEATNYLEIFTDKLVKNFVLEVKVYKEDQFFDNMKGNVDSTNIQTLLKSYEENKVATLKIPIELNDQIYKNRTVTEFVYNKTMKTDIGDLIIEKVELSDSRSRVYCSFDSDEYELLELTMPRLIDSKGKEYHYAPTYSNYGANNRISIELVGGIKDTEGLSFKVSGLKYIKKKDKNIVVDLKNKLVEKNDLGIEFLEFDGNKLSLKATKGFVGYDFRAKNEKGDSITIKSIYYNVPETQDIEFSRLQGERIIFTVNGVDGCSITTPMERKLGD